MIEFQGCFCPWMIECYSNWKKINDISCQSLFQMNFFMVLQLGFVLSTTRKWSDSLNRKTWIFYFLLQLNQFQANNLLNISRNLNIYEIVRTNSCYSGDNIIMLIQPYYPEESMRLNESKRHWSAIINLYFRFLFLLLHNQYFSCWISIISYYFWILNFQYR